MRTTSLLLLLALVGSLVALAPGASAAPDLEVCSSMTDDGCAYMLCWHPHENEWGTVAWCDVGILWPCQYCVPPEWD